ncbi:MAG: glycosyltransferase family 10 [Bdellovibrionaceae bacterium]|nr:glycosyltransferase family 10 [Pseudobdellovibrionaceae bacterium]
MKPCSLVVEPYLYNNRLFAEGDPTINRDDCLAPYLALRKEFTQRGYDLQTHDQNPISNSEFALYNEIPKDRSLLPTPEQKHKSFVFLFENEIIHPQNWVLADHSHFKCAFTWNDGLVRSQGPGTEYVSSRNAHLLKAPIARDAFGSRKLCTLIAGNRSVSHPRELYSKRRDAIAWFEHNHPEDFDYYGVGWERSYLHGGIPTKILRKLNLIRFLPERRSRCYRGPTKQKLSTFRGYRFSICFENAVDIEGYITEKIFDSFFAGCVPVYWGAPNIQDHIPENCFLDFRKLGSFEAVYARLKSMTETEWLSYLDAIDAFLLSPRSAQFSADAWAKATVDRVLQA